ncbi:MAG: HAMP domain-containing protein [Pleurocapsa minor HA4230-MV1]|jgi:heavy metal sensor kinase|nr:HAMP domain-containing protein [Pleurocapsa minor HA4230-MV1]
MFESLRLFWRAKRSLRVRLTAWYLLLLGGTLMIFSGYLYLQLKFSLLSQLDTTLKVASTEILTNLVVQNERINFSDTEQFWSNQQQLTSAGFSARIIASDGTISDGFGNYQTIKILLPHKKGYQKLSTQDQKWRTYNLPLAIANSKISETTWEHNRPIQWLQVAQSLEPVTKALAHLLTLILFGFPLILFFASLGGLFLADRALSPINRIIRTAEAINSDDLSYRINYQGVSDEVGRLAMTFDRMLNRIELAFEHERRFIADASHELRTPLTVIKGKIGVILSRQRTPAEYETVLQELNSQTNRLIRLTNNLLFLARLEQEQLQGKEDLLKVDLSSLLEVLIEQIQLTDEYEIDLQAEIIPNLFVLGNSDLLTSLFLNILDNAVKYTPPGEQIRLTTKLDQQQKQIIVAIANTGVGIAAEDLPYLFDRFYRLNRDRASHNQGSGLGLAIAALITRYHGGQIAVTSQDELTTFEVVLPSDASNFSA